MEDKRFESKYIIAKVVIIKDKKLFEIVEAEFDSVIDVYNRCRELGKGYFIIPTLAIEE